MNEEIQADKLLQPYRGTKDYFPKEMQKLNYIFNIWRKACNAFGYEEYLGPLLENRRLYTTKSASGDEVGNKQLYWFTDSAGRELGIRPEMTPTVSRMIGQKINNLPKPVRWFSIANFMRNERPQKGRTREFFQLNADVFGVKSVAIDAELVELAIYMMKLFGAGEKMFEIRINNRQWFTYWLTQIVGITQNTQGVSRIIDNFAKYTKEENMQKLTEIGLSKDLIDQLFTISEISMDLVRSYQDKCSGAADLVGLLEMLKDCNLTEFVRFDPTLVRGFDYYTGNVFEQFDLTVGNNRSMFGGGRYDNLVGIYSGIDTPANGFAPGNVTTELFLDSWNLWPKFNASAQVLVTVFSADLLEKSNEIIAKLREQGISCELYLGEKPSISDQLSYAAKKEIPYVIIYGPDEISQNKVVLKDMVKGEQKILGIGEIFDILRQ